MNGADIFWSVLAVGISISMIIVVNKPSTCQGIMGRLFGHKFKFMDSDLDTNQVDNCLRCGKLKDKDWTL